MKTINLIKRILPDSLFKKAIHVYREMKGKREAEHSIRFFQNKDLHHPVRVGFLVQMPEVFDQQESVYRRLLADSNFEVFMIIVPAFDIHQGIIGEYGPEKDYFIEKSGGRYILAMENGHFQSIDELELDYVFYQRPYDFYLPELYQSWNLVKSVRICYIPYAVPVKKNDTTIYPDGFFQNLFFGFMGDASAAELNNRRHPHQNHVSFYDIGYPAFGDCLRLQNVCDYRRVLWTPRWSYDPVVGGSHFFEYNDFLTSYEWGKAILTVRPHPLMWQHFLEEGRLEPQDEKKIRKNWEAKGIRSDNNKNVRDSFMETDILISDMSSVIFMFFLTGRPVIYCPFETEYGELFETILPGLYIARSEVEMKNLLDELLAGKDILRDTRRDIIESAFRKHYDAADQIAKKLLKG